MNLVIKITGCLLIVQVAVAQVPYLWTGDVLFHQPAFGLYGTGYTYISKPATDVYRRKNQGVSNFGVRNEGRKLGSKDSVLAQFDFDTAQRFGTTGNWFSVLMDTCDVSYVPPVTASSLKSIVPIAMDTYAIPDFRGYVRLPYDYSVSRQVNPNVNMYITRYFALGGRVKASSDYPMITTGGVKCFTMRRFYPWFTRDATVSRGIRETRYSTYEDCMTKITDYRIRWTCVHDVAVKNFQLDKDRS